MTEKFELITLSKQSSCKSLGQLDEYAPIRRILDFSQCNYKPQTLSDGQVDLIVLKQPQ